MPCTIDHSRTASGTGLGGSEPAGVEAALDGGDEQVERRLADAACGSSIEPCMNIAR